jgi:branched-subunit amino acid transport protein
MRASAIVLAGGRTLPPVMTQALAYAKHAVLAALVGGAVAGGEGLAVTVLPSPQLLGAIAGGLVAWRCKGLLRTLVASVAVVIAATAAGLQPGL